MKERRPTNRTETPQRRRKKRKVRRCESARRVLPYPPAPSQDGKVPASPRFVGARQLLPPEAFHPGQRKRLPARPGGSSPAMEVARRVWTGLPTPLTVRRPDDQTAKSSDRQVVRSNRALPGPCGAHRARVPASRAEEEGYAPKGGWRGVGVADSTSATRGAVFLFPVCVRQDRIVPLSFPPPPRSGCGGPVASPSSAPSPARGRISPTPPTPEERAK